MPSTQGGKLIVAPHGISTLAWDDIRVAGTSAVSNPSGGVRIPDFIKLRDNGAGSEGVYTWQFTHTQDQDLFFSIQMPHSWKLESTLHPHVHWCPVTAVASKNVKWIFEYTWAKVDGTFGETVLDDATGVTDNVAYKHILTSFDPISGVGINTVSSMFHCRLARDNSVADNYGASAALLEFDIHFQLDGFGSTTEFTK